MTRGKMITEKKMLTERQGIPTKSRIAAWWMLITSVIAEIIGLVPLVGLFMGLLKIHPDLDSLFTYALLFVCAGLFIFYLLPGLLVLKGGRWGWIIASAILSIAVVWVLSPLTFEHYFAPYSLIALIPFLIPLILILSDHVSYKLVLLLPILIVIIYFASIIIVKI